MCVLVNQLEEEKKSYEQTLKKEKHAFQQKCEQEKLVLQKEKHALQQKCEEEKQVLQKELNNFKKVVKTMKGKLECPVCMELPKKGPVPMCSNGHFICCPCLDKRKQDGKHECATCKVGMRGVLGDIKSLLATVVLENVEHQCDLPGCSQMVYYREYKKHQEQCEHRIVICPGYSCSKLVPFKDIPDHILVCPGKSYSWIEHDKSGYALELQVPIEWLGKEAELVWNTYHTYFNSRLFFLKIRKLNNIYSLEVSMHGSQTDCDQYKADISILDSKSDVVFRSSYHPTTMNTDKWGDFSLCVPEKALAKIWKYNSEEKGYDFNIAINISHS